MAGTTASTEIEITGVDGTVIPLSVVAVLDEKGNEIQRPLSESLAAAQVDSPKAEWLEPEIQEDWSGGVGLSYRQAPGVYTRTPGYACPAGYATDVTLPAPNNSSTQLVGIKEFNGDLWVAQAGSPGSANTARVMQSVGKTAALTDTGPGLGAGNVLRDLLVADDGAGVAVLWATGFDGSGGRMHRYNAGWASSVSGAFGSDANGIVNRRQQTKRVFWRTNDGVGAHRMVSISGPKKIAYTLPNADPRLAAAWVEAVGIDTNGTLNGLAAARRHVWVGATDNLYDLTADGDSPGLEGYTGEINHAFGGTAVHYHDEYVYQSTGQGLTRVYVGDGPQIQETPGHCAPGWGTEAEHEYRGWVTAMCSDQGYLVAAVYVPSLKRTGIFWGKDAKYFPDVRTRNPLVWFGPEVHSTSDVYVTAMQAVAVDNGLRLYIGAFPYTTASTPTLTWVSLPVAGAPIEDILAGGDHRFATGSASGSTIWQTFSRIQSLPLTWKDTNASKFVHEVSVATRGLDSATTTKLTAYLRADPAVGSTSYSGPQDITANPSTAYTPTTTTAGKRIDWRVDFFSPSGNATPPVVGVLDAVRITAWRNVPTFRVLNLRVEFGDGVTDLTGRTHDTFSPEQIKTHLLNPTLGGRTTLRLADDSRWSVKLRQVLDIRETPTNGTYGKYCIAEVQCALLSSL